MNTDCDVVVVGGGLVGLSLGCALANQSYRVRVLEAATVYEPPDQPGLRVSAINPFSQRMLEELGAWDAVSEHLRCPFSRMRVWDEDAAPFSDRALEFAGPDLGVSPLGHIVHNDALQWALYQRACELEGVEVLFDTRVEDIAVESDGVRVFASEHAQHTARLVIGADGMRSQVRELSGIEVIRKSYAQQGIVCNVQTERDHENTAWQRFLATGPIALLPLRSGECSIVWSLDNEEAERLKSLDDAEFGRELGLACDHVLGAMAPTTPRASFPLGLLRAQRYSVPRVVLVGDAAHVVHPLAGQGVNLGFGDVIKLVEVLAEGEHRGDRVGDRLSLRKFERARKYENRKMQMTIDGLHHLFANQHGWLRQSRSIGMGLLNQWPSVKGQLARHALGTDV